ncbi:hypothetical protein V565_068100 [Rhizoctonia solani 123E]|uniref:Uncharacterized protein n=1 Tax=Rhizoctonia solani 123E TaxID=1423351 RepID=A0A074SLU3_9AGAM|nr:hypothetical protein V565_068100 [Rhizoctonia solani 123E]
MCIRMSMTASFKGMSSAHNSDAASMDAKSYLPIVSFAAIEISSLSSCRTARAYIRRGSARRHEKDVESECIDARRSEVIKPSSYFRAASSTFANNP